MDPGLRRDDAKRHCSAFYESIICSAFDLRIVKKCLSLSPPRTQRVRRRHAISAYSTGSARKTRPRCPASRRDYVLAGINGYGIGLLNSRRRWAGGAGNLLPVGRRPRRPCRTAPDNSDDPFRARQAERHGLDGHQPKLRAHPLVAAQHRQRVACATPLTGQPCCERGCRAGERGSRCRPWPVLRKWQNRARCAPFGVGWCAH
jgi:hypothetical protein